MRHILIILVACIALVSCSNSQKLKQTAVNYLKIQIENSGSVEIKEITIRRDTIPVYLNANLLRKAGEFNAANLQFMYYDRSPQSKQSNFGEWFQSKSRMVRHIIELTESVKSAVASDSSKIEDVAYIEFNGTTVNNEKKDGAAIILIDHNDNTKVLGHFFISPEFIANVVAIKMAETEGKFKVPENEYGQMSFDGMSFMDKFILTQAK